jgi:hypothetical protein
MTDIEADRTEVRLRAYLADVSEQPMPRGLLGFSPPDGRARVRPNRPLSLAASALVVLAVVAIGTVTWVYHRNSLGQQAVTNPPGTGAPPSPGTPPPRFGEVMAYDPVRKQAVLFGGEGAHASLADTWTWDGHSWEQQHPATSPPSREGASTVYDPALGAMLLVGGYGFVPTSACPDPYRAYEDEINSPGKLRAGSPRPNPCPGPVARNDMWAWDGTTWREMGAPPLVGVVEGMAWDATTQQVVAIAHDQAPRTWVLSGTTWSEQDPTWITGVSPEAFELATNPANGRPLLLIFGAGPPCGGGGQAHAPSPGNHGLDSPGLSSDGGTINCGTEAPGGSYSGYIASTWTWIGGGWKQLFSADMPFPPGPIGSDASSKALVLLVQSGTWTWTGSDWVHQAPSPSPPISTPFGSGVGAMAQDPAGGHVVYLAAGSNCSAPLTCSAGAIPGNTTWIWDGRAWSRVSP